MLQIIVEREKICLTQACFRNIFRTVGSFSQIRPISFPVFSTSQKSFFNSIFRFLPFSSIFRLKREDTIFERARSILSKKKKKKNMIDILGTCIVRQNLDVESSWLEFTCTAYDCKEPYLLSSGTIRNNKNVANVHALSWKSNLWHFKKSYIIE